MRGRAFRYAPKAAAAARHEVPVIVALVAILLRLLHGLVIVLLLADGGGLGGRDRSRLLAARVHSVSYSAGGASTKESGSGEINNKLGTPDGEISHAHSLSLPHAIGFSGRSSSGAEKKNAADKLLFYADAGRKHVAANTREFP